MAQNSTINKENKLSECIKREFKKAIRIEVNICADDRKVNRKDAIGRTVSFVIEECNVKNRDDCRLDVA